MEGVFGMKSEVIIEGARGEVNWKLNAPSEVPFSPLLSRRGVYPWQDVFTRSGLVCWNCGLYACERLRTRARKTVRGSLMEQVATRKRCPGRTTKEEQTN